MSVDSGRWINPVGVLQLFGWVWAGVWALFVGAACHVLGVDRRKRDTIAFRPLCWVFSHRWADEERFGVQPVCLSCHKSRDEVSES